MLVSNPNLSSLENEWHAKSKILNKKKNERTKGKKKAWTWSKTWFSGGRWLQENHILETNYRNQFLETKIISCNNN